MSEELVVVEQQEEVTFEQRVEAAFMPKIVERNMLAGMYEELINKELTPQVCEEAKELGKKLVKVRTGIDGIHKTQKDYFLAGGRFVDSWKKKETDPVKQMEIELKKIARHFELIEEEKMQRIHESRKSQLEEAEALHIPENLAILSEEAWTQMLNGAKMFQESEKKRKEEERLAKVESDKIEKLSLERKDFILNNNLFQYREGDEDFNSLGEITSEDWTVLYNKLRNKQQEADAERQMIADENEALRKKNAKIAQELKSKEDEENRIAAKEEADLAKGDSAKLRDLVADLKSLKSKYEFKSKAKKKVYEEVGILIDKLVTHIEK